MKTLKKIVAVTAALSTVACLSVSAFATTATYSDDANTVAVTDYGTLAADAQYTVVVVPADAEEITQDNIYYINQAGTADFEDLLASLALKDGTPNGTYEVRFGTDSTTGIEAATFKIPTESGDDEPTVITITAWGDLDGADGIDLVDVDGLVSYILGTANTYGDYTVGSPIAGTDVIWGDIDGADGVDLVDVDALVSYILGTANTYGNYTVGSPAEITVAE